MYDMRVPLMHNSTSRSLDSSADLYKGARKVQDDLWKYLFIIEKK